MGVPTPVIVIIVLIMSMFAVAGIIIFNKRDKSSNSTIDPYPAKKDSNLQ